MGVVDEASGSIESCLDRLEETYSSFSINQTTLAVSTDRYERIRADDEKIVDLHAKVRNDDGEVLHVRKDQSLQLPATRAETDDSLESTIRSAVEETADISCRIDGIEQVTIVGVRDSEDDQCDTVYRLAVVFEAAHTEGTLGEGAIWKLSAVSPLPA